MVRGLAGLMILALVGCGDGGDRDAMSPYSFAFAPEDVEAVAISPNPVEVRAGESLNLRLMGLLRDGSTVELTHHGRTTIASTDRKLFRMGMLAAGKGVNQGTTLVVGSFEREGDRLVDVAEVEVTPAPAPIVPPPPEPDFLSYDLEGAAYIIQEMEDDPKVSAALDITSNPVATRVQAFLDQQPDLVNPYRNQVSIFFEGGEAATYAYPLGKERFGYMWLYFEDIGQFNPDYVEPFDTHFKVRVKHYGGVGDVVEGSFSSRLCEVDVTEWEEASGEGRACSEIPWALLDVDNGSFSATIEPHLGSPANPKEVLETEGPVGMTVHAAEGGANYHYAEVLEDAWYTVAISGLSDAADLAVFGSDPEFTRRAGCLVDTTGGFGLADESCVLQSSGPRLYFEVAYTGTGLGATYQVDVTPYDALPDLTVRIDDVTWNGDGWRVDYTISNVGLGSVVANNLYFVLYHNKVEAVADAHKTEGEGRLPRGGTRSGSLLWKGEAYLDDTLQMEVDFFPIGALQFLIEESDETNNLSNLFTFR